MNNQQLVNKTVKLNLTKVTDLYEMMVSFRTAAETEGWTDQEVDIVIEAVDAANYETGVEILNAHCTDPLAATINNDWLKVIKSMHDAGMVSGWIVENAYPVISGITQINCKGPQPTVDLAHWVWSNRKEINKFIRNNSK